MFFINYKKIYYIYNQSLLILLLIFLNPIFGVCQTDSSVFTTYFYEGGAKSSEGNLRNNKPDGYWKSYYRNGKIKTEGNRKEYVLDGPWKFYDDEGELSLIIEYKEGLKEGLKTTFKDSKIHKKEIFRNDKKEDYASYYFKSGALKQEVPYKNDVKSGIGYEYNEDGLIVQLNTFKSGELVKKQRINQTDQNEQKQGLWKQFHLNRNVKVEGTFMNDLKNGYWKFFKPSGDLIRVEKWRMGVLEEDASETAKIEIRRVSDPITGRLKYSGAYRNGIKEGVHREFDANGNVISSEIYSAGRLLSKGIVDELGQKQGEWEYYYADSSLTLKAKGKYQDGLKVKKWEYFYPNSNLEQEGSYSIGLADGVWTWYYEDGSILREEVYFKGLEDGLSTEYSDSGTVISKGQYVEGLKEGAWIYHVNDYREEGSYFESERIGTWKHYNTETDQLIFEGTYENDIENGKFFYYYSDGSIKRRGSYSAGLRDGIWEFFDQNNELIISIEYKNGEEIKYNGEKIKYGRKLDRDLELERSRE